MSAVSAFLAAMAVASIGFAIFLRTKRVISTARMVVTILLSTAGLSWNDQVYMVGGVVLFIVQALLVARTGLEPTPPKTKGPERADSGYVPSDPLVGPLTDRRN